jgi:sulfatase maturation enzyme AslB (radical SAM superfamily)
MNGYRLLPFRFLRFDDARTLLVNEAGEHHFLGNEELGRFVHHELDADTAAYPDLKAKQFLFDSDSLAPFELLATKYRTKKSFLDGFTSLHIFVVTLRCEHSCHYCQVSRVSTDRARYDMTEETALRALDLVFRSPAPRLKIEIQGGEPLLHFARVRQLVSEGRRRADAEGREVAFVIATNLALLTDEMLAFFHEHDVFLSTSLDGPAALHDANRPRPGNDSHARAVEGIERARAVLGRDRVAALMTTTRLSLQSPEAIVDEYVRLGFPSIFLRPLSPYGFARRSVRSTGYSMREFRDFYVRALDHILMRNAGGTWIVETYAQRQKLYPESARGAARGSDKIPAAEEPVFTAGRQDCGWSQVGLSRRRSDGCWLAGTSDRSAEGGVARCRCVRRSGADRSCAGVKRNTSHRAAGSCGLTGVDSEREMVTTSPRARAAAVRPAQGRRPATYRRHIEGNDDHRSRGARRAEGNVRR